MRAPAQVLRLLIRPLEVFFRTEALGGTVLIGATLVAMIWANSGFADHYQALWSAEVTVGAPGFGLSKPLLLWVNELLMAVFFLVVGLEIKHELLIGELDSLRRALLPVIAAVGGMVVPALVFFAVAHEGPAAAGWGIPMATDIAFALGCLRMLGNRVPPALVVFLAALAIIDDLGAILVIALFYSGGLSWIALAVAAVCTIALVGMNILGVRRPSLYVVVGIPLWVAILKSGAHATIAGVIVGLCVPARARFTRKDVLEQARLLLDFAAEDNAREGDEALRSLEQQLDQCESPLSRLENSLHPWVAYAIVPIFALANAGISLSGIRASDLVEPAALGVALGLFLGKQVGVFAATALAVRFGLAALPTGVRWIHLYGASLLAGIGFTMSLFIAGLAYPDGAAEHLQAKLGIVAASLVCGVAGLLVLSRARPAETAEAAA